VANIVVGDVSQCGPNSDSHGKGDICDDFFLASVKPAILGHKIPLVELGFVDAVARKSGVTACTMKALKEMTCGKVFCLYLDLKYPNTEDATKLCQIRDVMRKRFYQK